MTRFIVATALLLSSSALSASVTFEDASLGNTLVTEFYAVSGNQRFDAVESDADNVPRSFTATSVLTAENADGTARTDGRAEASADVNDPASGTIAFTSLITAGIDGSAPARTGLDALSGGSFFYRFSLTTAQRFDLSYANTQTGSDSGGANAAIFSYTTFQFLLAESFNANAVGIANAILPIGSYYLFLNNQLGNGSVRLDNGTGSAPLSGMGTSVTSFGFTFAEAVPEPDSWAMMLTGVGLVGAAMRRRAKVSSVRFA